MLCKLSKFSFFCLRDFCWFTYICEAEMNELRGLFKEIQRLQGHGSWFRMLMPRCLGYEWGWLWTAACAYVGTYEPHIYIYIYIHIFKIPYQCVIGCVQSWSIMCCRFSYWLCLFSVWKQCGKIPFLLLNTHDPELVLREQPLDNLQHLWPWFYRSFPSGSANL